MKSEFNLRSDSAAEILREFFNAEVASCPRSAPPVPATGPGRSRSFIGSFADIAAVAATLLVVVLGFSLIDDKSPLAGRIDESASVQLVFDRTMLAAENYLQRLRF